MYLEQKISAHKGYGRKGLGQKNPKIVSPQFVDGPKNRVWVWTIIFDGLHLELLYY